MQKEISYTEYYCDICKKKIDMTIDDSGLGYLHKKYRRVHNDPIKHRNVINLPFAYENNEYYYDIFHVEDICDDCIQKVIDAVKDLIPKT